MEPEQISPILESKQNIWTSVTPLSKYIAMTLFILMPFVGGFIGYNFAPKKLVEVERVVVKEVEINDFQNTTGRKETYQVFFDDNFYYYGQDLPEDRVFGDFYVHQEEQKVTDREIRLIDLKNDIVVKTINSKVLTFLGTEAQKGIYFEYKPSPSGSHIFIDGSDECGGCNIRNEVILTWRNGVPSIVPLPNITEFEWLDDDRYEYLEAIYSPEICEDVEGLCYPYLRGDRQIGTMSDYGGEFLLTWDGKALDKN